MIFAWINPLIYLYRKAIQLNHEFLADEFVVNKYKSNENYQYILLEKGRQPKTLLLLNSFSYLQTKKRIIMMSKKTSQRIAILKQIAIIPVIVVIGFHFTTKIFAQDKKTTDQQQATTNQQRPSNLPEDYPSFNHDEYTSSRGFESWVASQIEYPSKALRKGIQGWVTFSYSVELDGTAINVNIFNTPSRDLGEAVKEVVMSSPKWMPPKDTSKWFPFNIMESIKFEIPEKVLTCGDIPVFIIVEQMPQFPLAKDASPAANGEAITEWVTQHLKYPKKAIRDKIEGTVIVRFIVNKSGKLENIFVQRSIHPLLDAEALRIISSMPDFKPGSQAGNPVDVFYIARAEFILPE